MEKRIETCALIAVKTIEALYGKITNLYDEDGDFIGEKCYLSLDNVTNIKEREEILLNLDVKTVKEELQRRFHNYCYDENSYDFFTELREIVMWANNGFIHY